MLKYSIVRVVSIVRVASIIRVASIVRVVFLKYWNILLLDAFYYACTS